MLINVQFVLIILLILTAVCGDYIVLHSKLRLYKALFDNATHAIIGGLSWMIVCINYKNHHTSHTLIEVFLCTAVSSLIDLDHFYSAHSFLLSDAVQLTHRPPLHSSTPPLLVTLLTLTLSVWLQLKWLQKFALIVFVAFFSHHTRDATRRGYWLPPFGSTPPVPYVSYIFLTAAIPYLACIVFKYTRIDKVYQYSGQYNGVATTVYVVAGVLGAILAVALILIGVLFNYVKHMEKRLKRMIQSGGNSIPRGESSMFPRIDSTPRTPLANSSSFLGDNRNDQGFPGRPKPPQSWQGDPQGGGGGYGFGRPPPQRGPAPQRPSRMGY